MHNKANIGRFALPLKFWEQMTLQLSKIENRFVLKPDTSGEKTREQFVLSEKQSNLHTSSVKTAFLWAQMAISIH